MKEHREPHISYSQLNMYLRCGEQYRRRYLEGHIIPPSGTMQRGKKCHLAEQKNFETKIITAEFLSSDAVCDVFSTEWEASKHEIAFTPEELAEGSPATIMGKMKDTGIGLLEVFQREQLKYCNPVACEDEFWVRFEGGAALPILGYIDRVDKGDVISELKFQSKSPVNAEILSDTQMTFYDLGYRSKYHRAPKQLMKQYAIATKEPKTTYQQCNGRSPEAIDRLLCRIEKFMDGITKGIFLPAAIGSWCCSPKWCGYWDTCKLHP